MPPATPNITLTATLDDLSGNQIGSLADPAKIKITLCGFGPNLPRIAGTAMLAKTGPWDTLYVAGTPASIKLWGNDQISPSGTFYTVEILDGDDNVVQCGAYQFIGPLTIDLSNAVQIVPPYGFSLGSLSVKATTGAYPGTVYNAPGRVIAVIYNGTILDPNATPTPDYTLSVNNTRVTLSFTTDAGDNVSVLCVQ
jgi:hypothetical protein